MPSCAQQKSAAGALPARAAELGVRVTWSIVARDPSSSAFGVAVTTKFFAVGALCPHAASGIGGVATQALINPHYGPLGLKLLAEGRPAAEVVRTLVEGDLGAGIRQVHVVDAQGNVAAHTGTGCIDWCGHRPGTGFSVAGNMLVGQAVIDRTFEAYEAGSAQPFARRLLDALDAGQEAGGDKRGKQSAALLIHSGEDYPEYSLRVDDHQEPLVELRRLLDVYEADYAMFRAILPSRAHPSGIFDRAKIEEVRARRAPTRP